MDYATASPSKWSQASPTATTVLKERRTPSTATPDNDFLSRIQVADDNDLQYKIYLELTKITNCLNAVAKHDATEAGPSVTERRSGGGFLASHHGAAQDSDNKILSRETAEYDALGQQFTTLVIISTFTANLIIGFLTLAHNTIIAMPSVRRVQNEVGMFFALGGLATHSGVIIIAGRCAALAFKYAKRVPVQAHLREKEPQERQEPGKPGLESSNFTNELNENERGALQGEIQEVQGQINQRSGPRVTIATENTSPNYAACIPQLFSGTYKGASGPATPCSSVPSVALTDKSQALYLSDFHRFIKVCETLQLLGTAIFFLGVMILIFMMFYHRVFSIMLLVGCISGPCLMSWIFKFWQISATNQLIRLGRKSWRRWMVEGNKVDGTVLEMEVRENCDRKGKGTRRWSKASLFKVHWSDTVDAEKCGNEGGERA